MIHDTELDGAGHSGRPRLTCYTCNNETLIKQPYMAYWQWQQKVAEFAAKHPSPTVDSYNEKLNPVREANK